MTKSINMFKINRKLRNTKYFLLPPVWMHEIWNVSMDRRTYRIVNWAIIWNKVLAKSICICLISWNTHKYIYPWCDRRTRRQMHVYPSPVSTLLSSPAVISSTEMQICLQLPKRNSNYEFSTNYRLLIGQNVTWI